MVVFVDESHQTVPQLGGMHEGDRSRKQTLVDFGFRLPSALDNRPLRFDEFLGKVQQLVFVSATPGPFELSRSKVIAEQLIREGSDRVDVNMSVGRSNGTFRPLRSHCMIAANRMS